MAGDSADHKGGDVVHYDDITTAAKLGVGVDEVVVNRITEEDAMRISAECLNLWSPAGRRIMLIILVMGFNQAGFGIDWAVIGNINSFQTWHDFFGFGNAGAVIGTM
jgi:hypothetical protein